MIVCLVLFVFSSFFVFFTMVGYPISLIVLRKIYKNKRIKKDYSLEPTISYLIVAHNEEKCIEAKLNNIFDIDYPLEKMQILVASDFCTDNTNAIVQSFIDQHPELNIVLNKSKEHKGKTNAQNETVKMATGEILIMTDANSLFDKNAIKELVSAFTSEDIFYVCGQLKYVNENNETVKSESLYWKIDLFEREIESNIQTITAGNGSIYAVRTDAYEDIKPIYCHDSAFPYKYALRKKKCLYNPDAISYEKAGESNDDEFKRKVRMNRTILEVFANMWAPLNILKYKWFSYFYFGHRTCRYLLWLNHLIFFITSIVFTAIGFYVSGGILTGIQIIAIIVGLISKKCSLKFTPLRLIGYYVLTVLAQLIAACKQKQQHRL